MSEPFPPDIVSAASSELALRLRRSLLAIRNGTGAGAGTAWPGARPGLIVTNHHVVPTQSALAVAWNGQQAQARVIARDPASDLVLLQASISGVEPAALRSDEPVRPGELAFAMGNPWGEQGALTAGVVLASGGRLPGGSFAPLRADVRLAPGNSGGPMVDARGRVLGINSMIAGGVAIAIPVAVVDAFVQEALQGDPGVLGVLLRPVLLPSGVAASAGLPARDALMVTGLEPGGAADQAGLLPGDVILGVNDTDRGAAATIRRLRHAHAQTPLSLDLLRGERVMRAVATPVARV